MNKEYIWWTLVNSSSSFISQIKNSIERRENVYISSESSFPWKNTFYELSRNALTEISSQKGFEFVCAKNESDPGKLMMMKMCPQSICSEYWPDMTYAEFLSQYDNLVLNNRIIWVKDIDCDSTLEKWFEFIVEYCKLSEEKNHEHAIFVVEYSGKKSTKTAPSAINTITFAPTYFDRYLFALSMLSDLQKVFSIKQYTAELACCLCDGDIELCGCLADDGMKLVEAPNYSVNELLISNRSDGNRFHYMDSDKVYSCILMAQIKIIFPAIEQFRLNFIKTHESAIRANLPITNSFNEKIDEPSELELSDLCAISRIRMSGFTDSEKAMLLNYKTYRNKLAHNNILNYQDIEKILVT